MKTYAGTVTIEHDVTVKVDEAFFSEEFMAEFRESFFDLQTIEQHIRFLAQSAVRHGDQFIEGYGHVKFNGHYAFAATYEKDKSLVCPIDIIMNEQAPEIEMEEEE